MAKLPKIGLLPLSRHPCIPNRGLLFLRCARSYKTKFTLQWYINAHIKSKIPALIFTQNLYVSEISVFWCAGRYLPVRTKVSRGPVPHLPLWQWELLLTSWTFPNSPDYHRRSSLESSGPSFHGLAFLYKQGPSVWTSLQLTHLFKQLGQVKKKNPLKSFNFFSF